MNTILLIIGVIIVACGLSLIVLNSTKNTVRKEYSNKSEESFYDCIREEIINLKEDDTEELEKDTEIEVLEVEEKSETKLEPKDYSVPSLEHEESTKASDVDEELELSMLLCEEKEESLTKQILDLSEKGLSVNEIAKTLNKGVREVDIILKINKDNC